MRQTINCLTLIIVLTMPFLCSCLPISYSKLEPECTSWIKGLEARLKHKESKLYNWFSTDDLEEQYLAYMCYNHASRHLNTNTRGLENHGKKMVEIIKSRSKITRDDFELLGMALILHKMEFNENYYVHQDLSAIESVRAASRRLRKTENDLMQVWLRQIEFRSEDFRLNHPYTDARCKSWSNTICTLNSNDFIQEFSKHDPETQFAILHCKLELLMLIDSEWIDIIARNGENIVNFLTQKLEHSINSYTIELVLRITMRMDTHGYYKIARKSSLFKLMKEKNILLSEKFGSWHRRYDNWLDSLQ